MANSVIDFITQLAGGALGNQPTLTGGSPTNQLGLYGFGMGGKKKQPGVKTMEGDETGLMNAGPEEQEKKSFWQSPGGGVLGTLLTTLGTAGLGAGLGALSGGRRGAGQGAAMGGGMAFLNDLMQRKAASQIPTNEAELGQKQQELAQKAQLGQLQYQTPEMRNYAAGLEDPGFATFQKGQDAAKNAITPYQRASLNLQQEGLDIKRLGAGQPGADGGTGAAGASGAGGGTKPLSAEATKLKTLADGAFRDINNLRTTIEKGSFLAAPGILDRTTQYHLKNLKDRIVKTRSGAGQSIQEAKEYADYIIPNWKDDYETKINKLNDMELEFGNQLSGITGMPVEEVISSRKTAPAKPSANPSAKPAGSQMSKLPSESQASDPRASAIEEAKRRGIWKE